MRILYFHQHFSTEAGSTGTRSYSMARALIDRGHRVVMVCGRYRGADTGVRGASKRGVRRGQVDDIEVIELELDYANHHGLLRRSATFLRFAVRSTWIAITEPCDLIVATSTPLTAGIPGIAGKLLRRRRFVFEVRDLWPELPKAMGVIRNPFVLAALSALEWACYRCADRCIALAPGIVDGIARRGVMRSHIALIPNAANLSMFGPSVDERSMAPGELRAVFAGTHGIANGLETVLDAAVELKARGNSKIRIELIGDGMLKRELQQRANVEGLSCVRFADPMPKAELARTMAAADVGLMVLADVPAFYCGTSPNKFFDYIASGLPVLCNYPGWISGLISESDCGIVIPPGDAASFADALEALAADAPRRREMGRNAGRLASRFDRVDLARKFAETVESVA